MKRGVFGVFVFLCSISVFAVDTELRLYRPMTETTSHPLAVVNAKKPGECYQQSHLILREDAWYCVAENKVYDPCFVPPFGSHLDAICPESPWSNNEIQITVTSPLDNSRHVTLDMSNTFPWAIELTNGEKCQSIETTEQFDGLPVHYRCEKNDELIGHVQRCDSLWKMLQHSSKGVETVHISRAWF